MKKIFLCHKKKRGLLKKKKKKNQIQILILALKFLLINIPAKSFTVERNMF